MSSSTPEYDIAVVGGGISGVYSGWRLLADQADSPLLRKWGRNGKLKVALIEGSDRIGGRLLSARAPGYPDTVCEIGGMRFLSSQPIVSNLVEKELKLPHYEQVVSQPNNLVYLRGQHLRFVETETASNLPYDLTWAEEQQIAPPTKANPSGADASGLIGWALSQLLPEATSLTGAALEKYLQDAEVDGTPLYKHGLWNLLARLMSPEAWQVARAMIGYDVLASNANAVDLTKEFFDFTAGVKYFLLNGGYDLVPWTLLQRFQNAGGTLMQKTWLAGFDKTTLDDGTTGVELHFKGGRAAMKARAIVLAMPKRSLELLTPQGPVLDPAQSPRFQELLGSVEGVPLYKLFVAYPNPWWTAVGVSQGRSLTDIPVRQCYYWPVNTSKGTAKNSRGMIMAYNDESSVDFWGGLAGLHSHRQNAPSSESTRLFARTAAKHEGKPANDFEKQLRKNWDEHPAPHEMVAEMHRQLMTMHGVEFAPDPVDAAFSDWSVDPYGGGVHFWNRGYKSWEILPAMTQPVASFPCFVCGEAYSTVQTWAEGALQTAEIMLQKHLGLPAPKWMPKGKAKAASA